MRGFAIILSTILLFTTGVSQSQSAQSPPAQGVNLIVRYWLFADPRKVSLCVGEEKAISVTVYRSIYPRGQAVGPLDERPGAEIQAYSNNPDIGQFKYSKETTATYTILTGNQAGSSSYATFFFVAKATGQSKIEFHVNRTGDPVEWGKPKGITLDVVVNDCYEAYASGLTTGNVANEWTKKNICSLDEGFFLISKGKSQGGGTTMDIGSQIAVFYPTQPPDKGIYFSTENVVISGGGKTFLCRQIAVGDYNLTYYTNDHAQGDIVLKGTATLICPGGGSTNLGELNLLVGIRSLKLSSGDSCEDE
jgi:hypothetical protein